MNIERAPLEAMLRDAIMATSVRSPDFFSWCGRRETPHPAALRRELTTRQLEMALRRSLTQRIYVDFYCTGGRVRRASTQPSPVEDADWLERLSRANRSSECRDGGWSEIRGDRRNILVRKDGITVRVDRRVVRRERRALSIAIPNEFLRLSPGFYMATSKAPFPARARVFRVYWNLRAEGAPAFVRLGTELLNHARIPFRLKIAAHPAGFDRCDAAVLYVLRSDRKSVFTSLGEMRRILGTYLEPETPVFTKAIAPGIAVAEDPPDGASFGASRCAILADALIRCEGRALSADERLDAVRSAFARRGLPLQRAFLDRGSTDVYRVLPER